MRRRIGVDSVSTCRRRMHSLQYFVTIRITFSMFISEYSFRFFFVNPAFLSYIERLYKTYLDCGPSASVKRRWPIAILQFLFSVALVYNGFVDRGSPRLC